jgi:hypothetical protein
MNSFLNENWREVVRDLAPTVGDAVGQVLHRLLSNVFELVPYDEAFPETI